MAGVALEDGHACNADFLEGEREGGPSDPSPDDCDVDIDDAAAKESHAAALREREGTQTHSRARLESALLAWARLWSDFGSAN